jgi:hypothetical protein
MAPVGPQRHPKKKNLFQFTQHLCYRNVIH